MALEIFVFPGGRFRLWIAVLKTLPTWLALTGLALANPAGPGESAIGFLEQVRSGELDLAPGGDTALAASTGERKREEIARRIKRLAGNLGAEPLALGPVRQEDDLAAVLVRTTGGFDPARQQVFPVALIRRGAAWLAAPLPASFENSGIGFNPEHRRVIDSLESWMLRERVILLGKLRDQSADELRTKINAAIPADEIRRLTSGQAGQRFLDACSGRRLPEILGLLGGASADPPEQWPVILNEAETAIRAPAKATRAWRLLTAPEVIRVTVFHDDSEDAPKLSVACLDPAGNPEKPEAPALEIVHLPIHRSADGLWRVSSPPDPHDDRDIERPLHELFPSRFALRFPAAPAASAAAIRDALLASFHSADPASWATLLSLSGNPDKQNFEIRRAAALWWENRHPAHPIRPLMLDFLETDSLAAAACQFFDPRYPDRNDIRFLIFAKTPAGWLWTPVPAYGAVDTIRKWRESGEDRWRDEWRAKLLADCPRADPPAGDSAPDPDACSRLVREWHTALDRGDIASALGLIAILGQPDSPSQALRNLGYELAASRRGSLRPEILTAIAGSRISAVSTRTDSDGKPSFPLIPIIRTAAGPRILLEIDLIQSSGRSREFLNRTALDRLKKHDPETAKELADHFQTHSGKTKP
jgi:hypothetical protein